MKNILNYLLVAFLVTLCLTLGRVLHQYIPVLPPSLYGMLLFALLLSFGHATQLMPDKLFVKPMATIMRFISFVFVPVSVGLMQYGDLILESGGKILTVGLTTTFSVITLAAWLSQKFLVNVTHD
ncbi:CidA/LrgA family protein [Paraglaciecola aquimarina]|uniref:CidA/LrgA family protein n=1 Tax=Paraglaciecola algarum TaxID=3050085 RepID=A0ABS9DAK8_9ALTE|nr:CidA/LrgA family protein [Paraglaciecola sp. G1-23]MCF2948671.1 CidA/LrgA family protein [Paraglaciecola sp. G1-23]